jgi:hypothetical protein
MLLLPNSCFIHVPKTGGSWVKKAIIASGIDFQEYAINGDTHIGVKQCPEYNKFKFKFAFVRHPIDFYRSYWQYKMTSGWDEKNPIDMEFKSDSFNEFLNNLLSKYPTHLNDGLEYLLGNEGEVDFIGKYENLVDDLVLALNMAGEVFDEDKLRNFPPYNVSNKNKYPANYDEKLENKVRNECQKSMKRFGYM